MPYPLEPPTQKHDLLTPPLPSDASSSSLAESFGCYATTAALFAALDEPVSQEALQPLTPVYSYRDAPPDKPLSRGLMVIGVATASLPLVRQLLLHEDPSAATAAAAPALPACWHRCTVAVKRADGEFAHRLAPSDLQRAHRFARLLRRLHREGAAAVLGRDRYGRFGILLAPADGAGDMALSSMNGGDGDGANHFEAQDFSAVCYVGHVDQVKEYLAQQQQQQQQGHRVAAAPAAATTTTNNGAAAGLWKPPGTGDDDFDNDNNAGDASSSGGGGGFWQPPGAGGDDNDSSTFGFGAASNGDGGGGATDPWGTAAAADPWNANDSTVEATATQDDGDDAFHADAGAAAADRFYSGLTRTLATRADSRIYHMRAYNGWVKATQISELDPKPAASKSGSGKKRAIGAPLRVLDLACGKGGDLGKWVLHPRGVDRYVGIDVARGSLVDAALRVRALRGKRQFQRCTFTCADLGADVPGRRKSAAHRNLQKLSTWSLQDEPEHAAGDPEFRMLRGGGIALEDRFDVVSIQFAIHYMMQTRKRARRFFQTVSELLEVGGNLICTTIDARVAIHHLMNMGLDLHFDNDNSNNMQEDAVISVGNGACRLTFKANIVKQIFQQKPASGADGLDENLFGLEYTFNLVEGTDHASGVGDAVNLPEWLIPIPVLQALGEEAGLEIEYAQNFHEFFTHRKDPSIHVGAHTALYNMKVLNRNGSISADEYEISRLYCAIKFRKVRESRMKLEEEEEVEEEEEEDNEAEEIDAAIKAKFLPMALLKAKKTAGADAWSSFSSEEKNRLTEIELRKLAGK